MCIPVPPTKLEASSRILYLVAGPGIAWKIIIIIIIIKAGISASADTRYTMAGISASAGSKWIMAGISASAYFR